MTFSSSDATVPPVTLYLTCGVITLVTIYILLPFLLSLILSATTGHQVSIGAIRWSLFGSKSCTRGWFVLQVKNVKIHITRSKLIELKRNNDKSKPNSKATSHTKPRTHNRPDVVTQKRTATRIVKFINDRLVVPTFGRLYRAVSALSTALVLFAIEVDFTVQVDQVLRASGTLSTGCEIGGILKRRKNTSPSKDVSDENTGTTTYDLEPEDPIARVGAWVSLGNLKVFEFRPHPTSKLNLPAFDLPERVTASLSAPFTPENRLSTMINTRGKSLFMEPATVRFAVKFDGQDEAKGAHLRLYEARRMLHSIEEIVAERRQAKAATPSDSGTTKQSNDPQDIIVQDTDDDSPSLLSFLRSVELDIPFMVVTAHYHTPLHVLASSPKRQLPSSASFAVCIKQLSGKLMMGGTASSVPREHREWFGKHRTLGIGGRLSFAEIDGRIQVDGTEGDVPPPSAKAFAIASSFVHVTSTWLPPILLPRKTLQLVRDFNETTLVIDASIGQDGQVRREFVDLPRLAGTVYMDGIELRIQAPVTNEPSDSKAELFFRTWASPELFCISFPNGRVNFGAEYSDRSVKRTEVDRRSAKRLERKTKESVPPANERREESHTDDHLVRELGVPPPPPISTPPRRREPRMHDATLSKELDKHSLRCTLFAHLFADALNVYVLATNHASSSRRESGSGWLNEQPVLPSDPIRMDIVAIGPVELDSLQIVKGKEEIRGQRNVPVVDLSTVVGESRIIVDAVGIDLWRPLVMSCLNDFLSTLVDASATSSKRQTAAMASTKQAPQIRPIVDSLPLEQCVYTAISQCDVRIAGSDPKNDERVCRGVALHAGPIIAEFVMQKDHRPTVVNFAARHSLEMREDIRIEANAEVAGRPGQRQALFKLSVRDVDLDPVVDARMSRGQNRMQSMSGHQDDEFADWELKNRANISDLVKRRRSIMPARPKQASKGILVIPHLAVRVRVMAAEQRGDQDKADDSNQPLDEIVTTIEGETITLRFELFSIYLCLVAISTARALISKAASARSSQQAESKAASPRAKRPRPCINVRFEVNDLHTFVTLPHNVPLFINVRRLRLQQAKTSGLLAEWDALLLAGECPTQHKKWDDIVRLRVTSLAIRPEANNSGHQPFVIVVSTESARLRIPFKYVFSRIVDNTASLIKATKQLVHWHVKGAQDWVLEPHAEGPKRVPKIELNVKLLAFEIQDDPFETRLNIIWRAGNEEQNARMERDAAFDAKVEAIRKADSGEPANEDDQGQVGSRPSSARKRKVNGHHTVSIAEASHDLKAYNSSRWIKRMRNAVAEQGRREEALTRRLYGPHSQRPDTLLPIDLLPASRSAPLARATLHDVHVTVSKTSFAEEELPNFLHDVGKGMPRDKKFTLLVPMHFQWKTESMRVQVRDYPLPLLLVPPMSTSSGHDYTSWECEADLVIAEEIGGPESIRRVACPIVPAHLSPKGTGQLYSIVVPRSAMPTKTYCTPTVRIRSPYATRIGWGNSIQPAIQDITKVIDTLTKATPDPSERIGFWDKIRLSLHWRVKVLFEGEGPVHFHLKGSRDPYSLLGFGAGFAKSWHGNVKFLLGFDNPDREFFQILSDEYVLGIPNLRDYVDSAATGLASREPALETDTSSTQHSNGTHDPLAKYRTVEYEFTKVCAKLINGVRWGMGAVLERACPPDCNKSECRRQDPFHRQCRFFEFKPHWQVHTKTADAIGPQGEIKDSFQDFRSDFIHFSISLTAPLNLALPSKNSNSPESDCDHDGRDGYNSMHFSPHAMHHFQRWWKLFDSTMSLPIRQGKLFPSATPPSKKFGKHCATIKYRFSLAPLFISHTYRQESWQEWASGETTVLGVKGKVGRFNVDLHQREQEEMHVNSDTGKKKAVIHKNFYMAEIDCDGVDLRAITAKFREPDKAGVVPEELIDEAEHEDDGLPPARDYVLHDEDLDWADLDDFNDAVYSIADRSPHLRVLPLLVCPRFTYYRQKDVAPVGSSSFDNHDNETNRNRQDSSKIDRPKTKFGKEPSHTCLMGYSVSVQIEEAQKRLEQLEKEAKGATARGQYDTRELNLRIEAVRRIVERLMRVRESIEKSAAKDDESSRKQGFMDSKTPKQEPPYERAPQSAAPEVEREDEADEPHLPHITSTLYQHWGSWENRYIMHNPTIQVSNATREVLLKWYYSSKARKGLMYHLSAQAIKFIRDVAREHDQKFRKGWQRRQSTRTGREHSRGQSAEAKKMLEDLIGGEKRRFWAKNESNDDVNDSNPYLEGLDVDPDHAADHLPDDFQLNSAYLCMIIKPQFALRSELDDSSTVILTAFRAQFKVFTVLDTSVKDDPISSHVLHQTYATLDGLQVFYPREQSLGSDISTARPVFVPLETLVDLRVEPYGFDRLVPRMSAALRYDKFNELRLRAKPDGNDGSSKIQDGPQFSHINTGTDRISVECDKFSVSANPDHFKAIYNVVTDLILYSDPAQKSRNSKVEAMVFTHDFSNLLGTLGMIRDLQYRIRAQTELQTQYQAHMDELDDEGWVELFVSRCELARLSQELSLVVEAITRAQDMNGASKMSGTTAGMHFEARASELVWHMHDQADTPFAKFSVKGVDFSWISKQDSSVSNRLIIKDLRALNSAPDHIFAEIIAKSDADKSHDLAKVDLFAAVLWNSLPPVGGISIVDLLEIHLHPLKLQLEHRVGRQILDYLFSQRRAKTKAIERKKSSNKLDATSSGPNSQSSTRPPSILVHNHNASTDSLDSSSVLDRSHNRSTPTLHTSASHSSLASGEHRLRKVASADVLAPTGQEEGLDAEEMRARAQLNRTFILVDITSTLLCLTYRSEKEDKSRLLDVYNITYRTPTIQYRNRTFSFLDLLNELKRDVARSIWSQKGALLGQLLQTAHRRLPLADQRSAAKRTLKESIRARFHVSPSPSPSPLASASSSLVSLGAASSLNPPSPLRHDSASLNSPDPSLSSSSTSSPRVAARDDDSSSSSQNKVASPGQMSGNLDIDSALDSATKESGFVVTHSGHNPSDEPEQIQLDLSQWRLLDPDAHFVAEPDDMDQEEIVSDTAVVGSSRFNGNDLIDGQPHSLPEFDIHSSTTSVNSSDNLQDDKRQSVSLPPVSEVARRRTSSLKPQTHVGSPYLNTSGESIANHSLDGESEETKARMLLGKSF
ncbi:Protein SABRE [Microbotryomycetes sp. JL221]|nr:Protein SABRE [Microbotryomycetes sp. JL221]